MVNINGKEWAKLTAADVQTLLSQEDFEESFYFEFKDDRVKPKKLAEEISAFANTFGGYILLGVSDEKQIEGCTAWNEQRLHTTIHDSITPTPSFDVKKLTIDAKVVYILKIEEGPEPPYITSGGGIYERLSSGSFAIKDSVRLSQIYSKREALLEKMEKKVSIPPADQKENNICGYVDLGFVLVTSDDQAVNDYFKQVDLKNIAKRISEEQNPPNLMRVGQSIVYTPGGVSNQSGWMPAHTNNFLEIMSDGSARMRFLLIGDGTDDPEVNMLTARIPLNQFRDMYFFIMGAVFPEKMVYAKKYESLTVRKQFRPTCYFRQETVEQDPEFAEENRRIIASVQKYQEIMGIDTIITDDRIPKTGLYTLDKRQMEKQGGEYTAESIIDRLFSSQFSLAGTTPFWDAYENESDGLK